MDSVLKGLSIPTTRFVLGLLLIAIAAIASHVVLVSALTEMEMDSIDINDSGRQRMLSEQTFRLAGELTRSARAADAAAQKAQLASSLELMRSTHERLAFEVGQATDPTKWDLELRRAYFDGDPSLDDRLSDYFAALEALIDLSPAAPNSNLSDYLSVASTHRAGLLSDLDKVVKIYEEKAQARLAKAEELHGNLMLGLLVLLLFEAIFVFGPLIQSQSRANAELRGARDEAQSELAARSRVLTAVSHEIRTPIGGVLGIIDQLKREQSPAERERALDLIEDSSQALLETLDAILRQAELSRDDSAKDRKKFRPSAIAQRVAELFRPLARRKSIQIELVKGSEIEAIGDAIRIQQVLANLVSNAVKFTQSGSVTVEVRPPETQGGPWAFVVSDTGPGIEEGRLRSIFDPFDTSGVDSLGRVTGSGLGLSITRDIVDAMDGQILVESEPGKGAIFTIRLPLDEVVEETVRDGHINLESNLYLALEKATDQIRVEAAASKLGWQVLHPDDDPKAADSNPEVLVILVEHSKLASVPVAWLEASDRVIVFGESAEAETLQSEYRAKTVFLPIGDLVKDSQEVLESVRDGID